MNIDELKNDLLIDKYGLDEELVQQPTLFMKVSEALVEAMAAKDYAKENLAEADAMLDGMFRRSQEKVTEAAIKNLIQLDPKHASAFTAYIEAKTKADLLSSLKEAFHQRSYMIRELCHIKTTELFEQGSYRSKTYGEVLEQQAQASQNSKFDRMGS